MNSGVQEQGKEETRDEEIQRKNGKRIRGEGRTTKPRKLRGTGIRCVAAAVAAPPRCKKDYFAKSLRSLRS